MHRVLSKQIIAFCVLATANGVYAQDLPGNALNGQHLAETACASCHEIRSKERAGLLGPPDFQAIADLPSTTALSLNVFLQSTHRNMPDFHLTRSESDDLIAYILSLRLK